MEAQTNRSAAQTPKSYPIALANLTGAKCVVVGGGIVGSRKVRGLLDVGADVTVVALEISAELQTFATNGTIKWLARAFVPDDLDGARLAFAATDVREVNAAVADAAHARNILCNIADAPATGDFYSLAIVRHGQNVIAVGTDGTSPKQAKALKQQISQWLDKQ